MTITRFREDVGRPLVARPAPIRVNFMTTTESMSFRGRASPPNALKRVFSICEKIPKATDRPLRFDSLEHDLATYAASG